MSGGCSVQSEIVYEEQTNWCEITSDGLECLMMNKEEHKENGQSAGKTRRRKGRLRRLVMLLLVLAALIWAGPYIASTDMARDMIVPAINSRIHGTVRIDEISLNWLGPCVVKGLRVTDTSGREVLHVEGIIWEHGAWRGITDYKKIGHVEVVKPNPKLIVGPDGRISLAEAFKLRKPSEKKPLPELFGQITVRDGNVSVVLANGQTGELSGLDARFDLNTLKDVAGEFSWDSVEMYDMVLAKATFKPTFRNERLDLPVVTIPVSTTLVRRRGGQGGRLRVRCAIDFSGPEPMLKIPGTLKVAENIPIDRELGSDLLSRMLVLFYEPQKLTGQVSLTVEDLLLPLGESIKRTGSGRGILALKDVKIQSDGLMTGLTNLGGLAPPSDLASMKISDLLFEIKDGRFYYDDLMVIFADTLDMKFSGSVGFDDTLDLIVSLPTLRTPEKIEQSLSSLGAKIGLDKLSPMLKKIPIPVFGPLSSLARYRIKLRITGSRQNPTIDWLGSLGATVSPTPVPMPKSSPTTNPADLLFDLLDELLKPKPAK